jgi:hypothetical protein
MIEKWLHINEIGGDPWVRPIWTAVHEARKSGGIDPLPKEIGELGQYISTRLNILPRIINRINSEVKELYLVAKNYNKENVYTHENSGYAFTIDDTLKYNLLADIDAILFELNSVCELMSRLFEKLYCHVGKSIEKGKVGLEIKNAIQRAGQNAAWFVDLDRHRNFFIHEGAPYFAIDISKDDGKYGLIIMKKNLKRFNNPDDFITLSDINNIVQGFSSARSVIQNVLISLFEKRHAR